MFTFTTLISVAIGALRLVITLWIRRRYGFALLLPQSLASVCVFLSALPELLRPLPWPLPFTATVVVLLPDLLFRRL